MKNKSRKGFAALFLCVPFILTGVIVFGQSETGQVSGSVIDASGAVIPKAKVTLKLANTEVIRETSTNQEGLYVFPNVQPAAYVVQAEVAGFGTQQVRTTVAVGSRSTINFKMEVGKVGEAVTVTESTTQVNVETQTLQSVINTRQVTEMPSLTRNPYAFVITSGNVQGDAPESARGVGVAINGLRSASTGILLDGVYNTNDFDVSVGQSVPLDSVQEYSVLTSNFTAEYGRASGGVVNLVVKGGSNEFHGSAYWFNRVSKLASSSFENNANGIAKPVFTRNQPGYSIGGPIAKNKLFFFHSGEWIRVRSADTTFAYIPTDQMLAASANATKQYYQQFAKRRSSLQVLDTLTRADLTGRAICGPTCSAVAAGTPMLDRVVYSVPSDAGGGTPQNTFFQVSRIDWNKSEKTQIYGRYGLQNNNFLEGSNASSPYSGYDTGSTQKNHALMASATHTFSPSLISQSKFSFNRFNNSQPLGASAETPTLYFGNNAVGRIAGIAIAGPGYLPFSPGNGIPFGGPQNSYQLYEDMSLIKGRHQFRFGGVYNRLEDNRVFGAYQNPTQSLGTNVINSFEGFLRGEIRQFQAAIDPQGKYPCGATATPECTVSLPVKQPNFGRNNRYNEWAMYAQDTWRVNNRLTLNLGLRYEFFGTQHNTDQNLDSNYYPSSNSNEFLSIREGSVLLTKDSPIGKLWAVDKNNFAPRVGFAWDPTGDRKFSIRGGYGLAYERNFGNVTFNVIQNPPNYAVIALISGIDIAQMPIFTSVAGPLAGSTGTKALPAVSLRAVSPDIRNAYAHTWSTSIERQWGSKLITALEYSGSKGVDLYTLENSNMAGAGAVFLGDKCTPGNCGVRLKTTQYSNINRRAGKGFSNYNGLNFRTEIQDLNGSGLTMRLNYTYSHAIDNLSDVFSGSSNSFNLGLLDPFNPGLDKGNASFDARHRVVVAGLWDIPVFKTGRGLGRQILGGWTFAPIFLASTGNPFTLYDSTNAQFWASARAMFDGPVARKGTLGPSTSTPNNFSWMNLANAKINSDWVNPITGNSEFGPFPSNMTGRNAFVGPGTYNLDLGLNKTFQLTERIKAQFRTEMYNSLNHSNLYVNTGDVDLSATSLISANRGRACATCTPGRRNVQLALKFTF